MWQVTGWRVGCHHHWTQVLWTSHHQGLWNLRWPQTFVWRFSLNLNQTKDQYWHGSSGDQCWQWAAAQCSLACLGCSPLSRHIPPLPSQLTMDSWNPMLDREEPNCRRLHQWPLYQRCLVLVSDFPETCRQQKLFRTASSNNYALSGHYSVLHFCFWWWEISL